MKKSEKRLKKLKKASKRDKKMREEKNAQVHKSFGRIDSVEIVGRLT